MPSDEASNLESGNKRRKWSEQFDGFDLVCAAVAASGSRDGHGALHRSFIKYTLPLCRSKPFFFFFFFLQLWNFTSEVLFKSVALPFFPSVTFYFISISIFYFYFYLYFSNFIINISGKKFKIRRERTCFRIFLSSGRVYSPTGPLRYDNFAL